MYLRSLISKDDDDDAVMFMSKRNKTFKARYNEKNIATTGFTVAMIFGDLL